MTTAVALKESNEIAEWRDKRTAEGLRTDRDLTPKQWDIRLAAEADLETFIRLVAPQNVMGLIHVELCHWMTRPGHGHHQLVLLPRDHGKSRYLAFRVAWWLTKHPDHRILYISSTSNLAEKQLFFIKQIFESKTYQRYWPEMIHPDEGKRAKWTNSEIVLDHPLRVIEGVRDPSIFTAGLTTGIVGMHCDVACLDDVVVGDNANSEEGRNKVKTQYSFLSSIEGGEAQEWAVGTRYNPNDLYGEMQAMTVEIFNENGEVLESKPVYEVFERAVEDAGDGTGEYLGPRQQRKDGKYFGFNQQILATKRAKYLDQTQFRAQYYNDPNSGEGAGINRSVFQYFNKEKLRFDGLHWYYGEERLNIIASIDFAFSISKRSDYTAIVVLGMDGHRNYYVLDVIRFKTDSIREYYLNLLEMYKKWEFRKVVAETVAAQQAVVKALKEDYLKPNGINLNIIETKPHRHMGSKEDRIAAILEPIYANMSVWHTRSGNTQILEDELVLEFPPHDDCKDALTNAVEHIQKPTTRKDKDFKRTNVITHPRFGGVVNLG